MSMRRLRTTTTVESHVRTIMSGMVGVKLKKLLRPLMALKMRRLRRRRLQRGRKDVIPRPDADVVVDVALHDPVLAALGDAALRSLLGQGVVKAFTPDEVVTYLDEPALSAGIVVVVAGEIELRDKRGSTREVVAPCVLGAMNVFTEDPSMHAITARTVVDAVTLRFQDVRWVFRGAEQHAVRAIRAVCLEPRRRAFATHFPQSLLFMRQAWITRDLTDAVVESVLTSKLVARSYFPGDELCTQGTASNSIIFVRRGSIDIIINGACVASHTGIITLGEMSTIFNERRPMTAVATSICDTWTLNRYEYEQLATVSPDAAAKIRATAIEMRSSWLQSQKMHAADAIPQALRRVPYLADAPDEAIEALVGVATPTVFTMRTPIASVSSAAEALFIVARGAAVAQQADVWHRGSRGTRFGVGCIIGETCVVDHRVLLPVCALSMVDAWRIPREALCAVLAKHGLLGAAEAHAEHVLDDVAHCYGREPAYRIKHPRPAPASARSPSPLRISSATRMLVHKEAVEGATDDAPPAPGSTSPTTQPPLETFTMLPSEPDIDFGIEQQMSVLQQVAHVPTGRHERFKSVSALNARSMSMSGAALQRTTSFEDVVREFHSEYDDPLAAQGSPQPSPRHKRPNHLPPPTFKVGAHRSDSRAASTASQRSAAAVAMRHQNIATYATVAAAERVGDAAPWLFWLLEREPLLDGYLEGSQPGPLDFPVAASEIDSDDAEDLDAQPNTVGFDVEQLAMRKHATTRNPYRPVNPFSYAPILPPAAAPPSERPPRLKWCAPESDDLVVDIIASNTDGDAVQGERANSVEDINFLEEEWERVMAPKPPPKRAALRKHSSVAGGKRTRFEQQASSSAATRTAGNDEPRTPHARRASQLFDSESPPSSPMRPALRRRASTRPRQRSPLRSAACPLTPPQKTRSPSPRQRAGAKAASNAFMLTSASPVKSKLSSLVGVGLDLEPAAPSPASARPATRDSSSGIVSGRRVWHSLSVCL